VILSPQRLSELLKKGRIAYEIYPGAQAQLMLPTYGATEVAP
jgi:hypothetical protein